VKPQQLDVLSEAEIEHLFDAGYLSDEDVMYLAQTRLSPQEFRSSTHSRTRSPSSSKRHSNSSALTLLEAVEKYPSTVQARTMTPTWENL
jgi:hypothetical protein